ncbi:hypothetical protein L195_g063530, partial [Trifolium pratense]
MAGKFQIIQAPVKVDGSTWKEFLMTSKKLMEKKERGVGWKFYTVGPDPYPMAAIT